MKINYPLLVENDAISVVLRGHRQHFICTCVKEDEQGNYIYHLFTEEGEIIKVDNEQCKRYLDTNAIIIKENI